MRDLGILILAALLCPNSPAQNFDGQVFPVGKYPESVVAADFNVDNRIDFVTANNLTKNISISLGGAEGFLGPVHYSTNESPLGLAAADFNNDGSVDVACAVALDNKILVFLNNGNGTFGSPIATVTSTPAPSGISGADFNQDGLIDVAAAHPYSLGILVLRAGGAGSFAQQTFYSTGQYCFFVTTGDFNQDFKIDLAAANRYASVAPIFPALFYTPYNPGNSIHVFYGDGIGGFGSANAFLTEFGPDEIKSGDINNDGRLDLVTSNLYKGFDAQFSSLFNAYIITPIWNNCITLLSGSPGGFANPVIHTAIYEPECVQLVQLNSDGFADVVVGSPLELKIFIGNHAGLAPMITMSSHGPRSLAAADVDLDGNTDVLAAMSQLSAVEILHGDGLGNLITNIIPTAGNPAILGRNLASADMNHDGHQDFIVMNQSQQIALAFGDGAGNYSQPAGGPIVSNVSFLAAADFNTDGAVDVAAAAGSPNQIVILSGDGAGALATAGTYILGASGIPPSLLSIADLNLDGLPDIVSCGKRIEVFINTGGVFAAKPPIEFEEIARLGDFNQDAVPDIVMPRNVFSFILIGIGDGTFSAPLQFSSGSGMWDVAVADTNNDAITDLVLGGINYTSSILSFLGTGNGAFQQLPDYPAENDAKHMLAGDVNRDGNIDIIYETSSWADGVVILLSNGSGGFNNKQLLTTEFGSFAQMIVAGDWNEDGKLDLAFAGGGSPGAIGILINHGSTPAGIQVFGMGTPACYGACSILSNVPPAAGNPNFAFTCVNAPRNSLGLLLIGDVQDSIGTDYFGYQIKIHLDPYLSGTLLGFDIYSDAGGTGFLKTGIPNDPNLISQQFFAQSVWIARAADGDTCSGGVFDLITSKAVAITVQ